MKKKKFSLKTKHVITIMTILCVGLIVLAASSRFSLEPVRQGTGYVISPFQNGINVVGTWMREQTTGYHNNKDLKKQNEELQAKVDTLVEENSNLLQGQDELTRLKDLYALDKSYSQFDKVAAQVISKNPGNWFSTFTINRGSNDGIKVDQNVIAAGGGLVGIVTEVGTNWATIRSIVDDSSNVSAMATTTSDTCVVTGNLLLMDEGKLSFIQMNDRDDKIQEGEQIVTSAISDKFLKGILIGYVSEVSYEANKLTKTGNLIPAVDFEHLHEVLVISELKQKGSN